MKFTNVAIMLAASAVAANGKNCEHDKKCNRVCELKGDPHLIDMEGHESMLHGEDGTWVDVYKDENGEHVQVKIEKNGANEYVKYIKVNNAEYNTEDSCGQPIQYKGSNGLTLKIQCAFPKPGQWNKVENSKDPHFDMILRKQYWGDVVQGSESGACVSETHQVNCDCAPTPEPTAQPTPEPSLSCKDALDEKCGKTPKDCFVGSLDESCANFIKCADENNFSECYQPKKYDCEGTLKRVCGRAPKDCYADSTDEQCTSYTKCADDHGYSECYKPPVKPFKQLTCTASCSAKGDPHWKTFIGEKYKSSSAGETITMVSLDGFTVDAYVDPVGDKEYVTKVTWGNEVMNAEDCTDGAIREIQFEGTSGSIQGTVKCALPKKTNLKGKYGHHFDIELRETFSIAGDILKDGTFETFVQAMGGEPNTECMSTGDDSTVDVSSWTAEKLAKKFHCH